MGKLWFKMDNAFTEHRKFLFVGPNAGYLHVAAIAWCDRNTTDGSIPHEQVERLVNWNGISTYDPARETDDRVAAERVSPYGLARKLVSAGLWEQTDDGYEVHDYLDWQQSAEEIAERSKRAMTAGRLGGKAKAKQAASKPLAKRLTDIDIDKDLKTTSMSSRKRLNGEIEFLFNYWREQCDHSAAKLTSDRSAKLTARLREGYTVADIQKAIDGAAQNAFVNEQGKKFDDLTLICRTGSKLEDFMQRAGVKSSDAMTDPAAWDAAWAKQRERNKELQRRADQVEERLKKESA